MSTWKVLTLGAALTGLGVAGAGIAAAEEGALVPAVQPISVPAADGTGAPLVADPSPESADSPFESPADSPESPYDSPDDHAFGDDTPEDDTPDDDTPDDD
jgi:hypothetical protein